MKIPENIVDSLFEQAKAGAPLEVCGYLAGINDIVKKSYPLTNIDQSEEHFSLDPKEQFQTMKTARDEELKILAVYHSHPATPSRPSEEDIRLAYDSKISYVIVSIADNNHVIKSFKIKDGRAVAENLEII